METWFPQILVPLLHFPPLQFKCHVRIYVCVFVGLYCKMYFLDKKSLQVTIVKLDWQIKAQINFTKNHVLSI